MGHWNYRIVKYRDDSGYGLHEVFYDDEGQPWSMTAKPVSFAADEPEEIVADLLRARVDARNRPILDEPKKWPGKNPSDRAKVFKLGARIR